MNGNLNAKSLGRQYKASCAHATQWQEIQRAEKPATYDVGVLRKETKSINTLLFVVGFCWIVHDVVKPNGKANDNRVTYSIAILIEKLNYQVYCTSVGNGYRAPKQVLMCDRLEPLQS